MVLWKEAALPKQGTAKVRDDVQESDVRRIYRDESAQQETFQSGWAPCNPVKRQVMLFIFFSKIVDPFP
jgi:hypothetical protein